MNNTKGFPDKLFDADNRSRNSFILRGAELLTAHSMNTVYQRDHEINHDQEIEKTYHPENFLPEPPETCPHCGEATENGFHMIDKVSNEVICNQAMKD